MQISVSTVEKHIGKALQVIRFKLAQWNRILLVGGILVATVVKYILLIHAGIRTVFHLLVLFIYFQHSQKCSQMEMPNNSKS